MCGPVLINGRGQKNECLKAHTGRKHDIKSKPDNDFYVPKSLFFNNLIKLCNAKP